MSIVPRHMRFRIFQLAAATVALVAASGCQPLIGDDCATDLDCSRIGDRICDTTQPGGYCTQFNCGATTCPEEAICIAFANTPSIASGCGDTGRTSPYVRNFCMRMCEVDGDCRPGYECVDLSRQNPWGADVVQRDPIRTSVCVLPRQSESVAPDALADSEENVCRGPVAEGIGGAGGSSPSGQ